MPTYLGHTTTEAHADLDALSAAIPAGRSPTTLLAYLTNNAVFNVMDYRCIGDGVADDTVPYQDALNAVSAVGGIVYMPPGKTFRTTAALNPKKRTTIAGAGQLSSLIYADHDGNGIYAHWGLNASTEASVVYRDFGIYCNRTTNTGGGIVDEGGSYVTLDHVYVQSFKHNVIFDQTEHGDLIKCYLNRLASNSVSGLWCVNGADRQVGAQTRFTNRISVEKCQILGSQGVGIRDDGGVTHAFNKNNINGGTNAILASDVSNLEIRNNTFEALTSTPVILNKVTSLGNATVGGCDGVDINCNTFSCHVAYHLEVAAGRSGSIVNNTFCQYTTAAVKFDTDDCAQWRMGQNSNAVVLSNALPNGPFLASTVTRVLNMRYEQDVQTFVPLALAAGAGVVVTPNTMGNGLAIPSNPEQIVPGKRLVCANADLSNMEVVVVKSTTGTTFTADFASAKSANWVIFGEPFPSTNTVGPDQAAASPTVVPGYDSPVQRFLQAFGGDQSITFSNNGAMKGTAWTVLWNANGAHNLVLKNYDGTTLKTASVSTAGWATVLWDENIGTYRLTGYGSL